MLGRSALDYTMALFFMSVVPVAVGGYFVLFGFIVAKPIYGDCADAGRKGVQRLRPALPGYRQRTLQKAICMPWSRRTGWEQATAHRRHAQFRHGLDMWSQL